jgi:Tol biopolymer transport system component
MPSAYPFAVSENGAAMRILTLALCLTLVSCEGATSPATRLPSSAPSISDSAGDPQILFVGDRDGTPRLFVIGADGFSNAIPLGNPPAPTTIADYAPSWSPDGRLIAHHRLGSDGRDSLVVIEAASAMEVMAVDVGFPPAGAADLSWAPDGDRVAYWSTGEASNEIRVLDLAAGDTTVLAPNPGADRFPAWAPTGDRIAFWSDRAGRGELWLVDTDAGADPVAIAEVGVANSAAAWSPDGSLIASVVQVGPDRWSTQLMTSRGETVAVLPAAGSSVNAAWSPDGTRLAYWDVGATRAQLLLFEPGDTEPMQLGPAVFTSAIVLASHPTPAWPPAPSWSSSGDRLVAELRHGDGSASLLTVSVATNAWRILDQVAGSAFSPSWKPGDP